MADYNPSKRTRAERAGVSSGGQEAVSIPVYPSAEFAEFATVVRNTMTELGDLLISKHRDYGPKNISDSPGGPLNGLRVRMHDKTARINNLVDNGGSAQHEPLEDSFKDLANYAIIALLVLRNQWDKG
jgi:hypothetical protein